MTYAVNGVGVSEIRQVSPEAHLQVNNFDPGLATTRKHFPRRPNGFLNRRNVDSCTVKQSALRTKVVLHVHNDYGRFGAVNRKGLVFSLDELRAARTHFYRAPLLVFLPLLSPHPLLAATANGTAI